MVIERALDRLKSEIWVQAQVRICGIRNLPVYVMRKGDADAGAIFLKLSKLDGTCRIYSQTRAATGELAWSAAGGGETMAEADADAYIERQASFDPDIWVVEIEDPKGLYQLDAEIL
jgi:hypothetical protein